MHCKKILGRGHSLKPANSPLDMEIVQKYDYKQSESACIPYSNRMESSLPLGKKINQLRGMTELRAELDKRGLNKSGLKATLVKRLEMSILETSGNQRNSFQGEDKDKEPTAPLIDKTSEKIVGSEKEKACKTSEAVSSEGDRLTTPSCCACLGGFITAELEGIKFDIAILQYPVFKKGNSTL